MTSDWYSASTVTSWQGAPFISRGNFVFVNGIFFAVVSGDNKHARASIAELQEHFRSGSAKDHPAHWFEAHLLHYGLKPSKVKSAARMRLFDAVKGGLSIPAHMSKIERGMKKVWTKMIRDAKKVFQAVSMTSTAVSTPAATETIASRGADEPVAPESEPKRPKAEPVAFESALKWPKTEAASPDTISMGSRPDMAMARRGGSHQGPGRASATRSMDSYFVPDSVPRQTTQNLIPQQTTRHSRPFRLEQYDISSPPRNSYTESKYGHDRQDGREGHQTGRYSEGSTGKPSSPVRFQALGLLNGNYDIRSETVENEWPRLSSNLSLVFTIAGREMWGQFDLGIVEGIMHCEVRPMSSSNDRVPFTWRGRETEGATLYSNNNYGWVQFLGDGRIEGELAWTSIKFSGRRQPGQGTRSPVDAQKMKNDWNGFTEERYEEESRGRWH
ncbi:hypothetical protein F5X68DRAFT_143542 [Plectosphaerella plurivora]|uniref:Uncharacterized protein n=1 Tax=Plectosphaerella plurivora TaxID=936078 RepID=A0A9P8V290_9PEZI|nr:hypothetical protein F5X68DRAFT_143542 [Plectosphaerella plurivora]